MNQIIMHNVLVLQMQLIEIVFTLFENPILSFSFHLYAFFASSFPIHQ